MNRFYWRLCNFVYRLLNPRFWIQVHPTNWEYDALICHLMQAGEKYLPAPLTRRKIRVLITRSDFNCGRPHLLENEDE